MNPEVIALLQHAVRSGNRDIYKRFANLVNNKSAQLCTLRGLFKFKSQNAPIPLEEVEPASAIVKLLVNKTAVLSPPRRRSSRWPGARSAHPSIFSPISR